MEQEKINTQNGEQVETETTTTEQVENNSEKTFTQAEVDEIVKTRLAKEKKGIPSKEELTKYNEWKESQKTQEDKYNDLVKLNGQKDTEISNLQKENKVLKAGITDQDEIEFIVYKVNKMEGDFEENLKNYLANSKFVEREEKATGIENKLNNVAKDDGVMAILKAKHPDIDF